VDIKNKNSNNSRSIVIGGIIVFTLDINHFFKFN